MAVILMRTPAPPRVLAPAPLAPEPAFLERFEPLPPAVPPRPLDGSVLKPGDGIGDCTGEGRPACVVRVGPVPVGPAGASLIIAT